MLKNLEFNKYVLFTPLFLFIRLFLAFFGFKSAQLALFRFLGRNVERFQNSL